MPVFYGMSEEQVFSRRLFQRLLLEQRLQESTASIPWHTTKAPAGLTAPLQWKIPDSQIHKSWVDLIPTLLLSWSSSYSRGLAGTNTSALHPAWGYIIIPPYCWKHISYPGDTWPQWIFWDPKGEILLLKEIFAVAEPAALEASPLQTRKNICASRASHIPPSRVIPTTVRHPVQPELPFLPFSSQMLERYNPCNGWIDTIRSNLVHD